MSIHVLDIGCTDAVRHQIDLTAEVMLKQKHRIIPPAMYDEMRKHEMSLTAHGLGTQSRTGEKTEWESQILHRP